MSDPEFDARTKELDELIRNLNGHCRELYRVGEDPALIIPALVLTAVFVGNIVVPGEGLSRVRSLLNDGAMDKLIRDWLGEDE